MKATKVNAGLAESNGRLLLGIWRDSLHVTCGLTACTPGSAPCPTLGNEYGKTLPFTFLPARRYASYHPMSVSLSEASMVSKQLNIWSHRQCHNRPGTLVWWYQRSGWNSYGVIPNSSTKCRCVRFISELFHHCMVVSQIVYIVTALGRLLVDLFLQLFSLAKVTTLKQALSSLLLPPLLLPASSDQCLLASITKTRVPSAKWIN